MSISIQSCFGGFIERLDENDEIVTGDFIKQKVDSRLDFWKNECKNLHDKNDELNFTLHDFVIEKTELNDVAEYHKDSGSGYHDVAESTGVVVGYIILIERQMLIN